MTPPLPLAGRRVLDLSQNLAGPYATQILADFGAEVIKVEPPGGDPARGWGPPFMGGESPLFLSGNRGKRSAVLDLRTEHGREALRRLVRRSDIFVQAFRAGVMDRLGFGYDAVRALRPDVVYVSVTAFGDDGPLRDEPGYDPLMQAYSGLMSVTGHPNSPPARVGTSLVDMGTGMWAAMAVLAELAGREGPAGYEGDEGHEGRGEAVHITTSLLDTSLAWMSYHLQGHAATGRVPGRSGTGLGMIAPYQAFPTEEAHVMIAAANDKLFRRLCGALDVSSVADDPRFATNADRVAHRDALIALLSERTRGVASDDLVQRLRTAGVPCAQIHDVAEVARDEQVAGTGMLRPGERNGAPYLDVALPVRWDGVRPVAGSPPPEPGADTAELLAEIGMEAS